MKKPSDIVFLADAMLGSVARKLRIFGFDTLYIAHIHDDDLLKIGIEQGRIVLTADRELFKRLVKAGCHGVLVQGGGDLEDLVHILSKNGITSIDFSSVNSRCSVCNGILELSTPQEVRGKVPDNVLTRHAEFYRCIDCSKIYWEGGHLKRIKKLAQNIDARLGKVAAT